jgi:hypothetical protein
MAAAQPIADTPVAREVAQLIARSRTAQAQIEHYTQAQIDRLIRGMVWAVAQPGVAEKIAQQTVDETQLGNYAGKFLKISRKTRATLMDILDDKSVGIIEEDPVRNLVKIAKPVGVIAIDQPRGDAGYQSDFGGQGPQFDHHCPASARQGDQCDDLQPDARCAGQAGRTRRPRHSD